MARYPIRILYERDVVEFKDLRLYSFQEAPLAFSESYEDEVNRNIEDFRAEVTPYGDPPEYFILGAFDRDNLIGFVKFRRDRRTKARHKSMIHAMYVKPDYRDLKIGQELIKEVLIRVQMMKGLEQIHLWVLHAKGKTAAQFYRRCGFISQGPIVKKDLKFNETYIDAEYMVMYL